MVTNPTADDLLYLVDNPGGTPVSRKTTIGNLGFLSKSGGTMSGNLYMGTNYLYYGASQWIQSDNAYLEIFSGNAINLFAISAINVSASIYPTETDLDIGDAFGNYFRTGYFEQLLGNTYVSSPQFVIYSPDFGDYSTFTRENGTGGRVVLSDVGGGFYTTSPIVAGGTLSLDSGSITDNTGQISFDNENLITTGDIDALSFTANGVDGCTAVFQANGVTGEFYYADSTWSHTAVGLNADVVGVEWSIIGGTKQSWWRVKPQSMSYSVYNSGTSTEEYIFSADLAGMTFQKNVFFSDNVSAVFGTGSDSSIYYDATNMVINPKLVGSGLLNILGNVRLDDDVHLYLGTGSDLDIYYNATAGIFDNNDVTTINSTGKLQFYGEYTPTSGTGGSVVGNYFYGKVDVSAINSGAETVYCNQFDALYKMGVQPSGVHTVYGTSFTNTITGTYVSGFGGAWTGTVGGVFFDVNFTGKFATVAGMNFYPYYIDIDITTTAVPSTQLAAIKSDVTLNSTVTFNQFYGWYHTCELLSTATIIDHMTGFMTEMQCASTNFISNHVSFYRAYFNIAFDQNFNTALTGAEDKVIGFFCQQSAATWAMAARYTYGFYSDLANNAFNYAFVSDGADGWMALDNCKWVFGTGKDASITFDGDSLNIVANLITAGDALECTANHFHWIVPANTDNVHNYFGTTNSGVLTWMEDEDYFQFSDTIMFADNIAATFGTGAGATNVADMKIYYDGTSGNIDTDVVAASDLTIDCGTAKTLVLEVPVYNDANAASLVLVTGGTLPGVVEILNNVGGATGIYTRGFAVGEQGSGSIEIPHDYKEGTNLVFHLHWMGQDAPTGTDNVKWQVTYTITREEVTTPAVITDSSETAFDTQYEWKFTDVETITGTNLKIGDQVNFTISRIASVGDAYAGEALVATIGFHYQCDTLGSRLISTK
jgi:hypothetical protein